MEKLQCPQQGKSTSTAVLRYSFTLLLLLSCARTRLAPIPLCLPAALV